MFSWSILLAGFGFAISLIAAIGAQNALVLRQGLLRQHVTPVVALCITSDIVLMSIGIAGFGVIITQAPWALTAIRLLGGVFLIVYGALALKRAMNPSTLEAAQGSGQSRITVLAATLAVTYLNPHVYLDTVVLLGSIANSHGDSKWWFGIGAMLASITWFTLLGVGSRYLQPFFAQKRSWQILDACIAAIMFAIAAGILLPLVVA